MSEQQYRVIKDRDKGDDVDHFEWDTQRGDHVVWEVVNDNAEAEIVRVERPVPTTDSRSQMERESDALDEVRRTPVPVEPPSVPTREQIADAFDRFRDSFNGDEAGEIDLVSSLDGHAGYAMRGGNDVRAVFDHAVQALIQKGTDR